MTDHPESPLARAQRIAELEQAMLDAITARFSADPDAGSMTKLRAVEVRVVTDNGDHFSGERMIYRTAEDYTAMFVLAAPFNGGTGGAEAPFLRVETGLGLQG